MERVKLEIAKIVGTPSPSLWSQVHTFIPEDPEKLTKRGKLLAVISLRSVEAGVETVALGREVLSRVHEEYFGNLTGGVFERLKTTLEKIKEEWPGTDIIAGVVLSTNRGEVFYTGILGKGKIFIKRGGALKEVLAGNDGEEIQTGSGLVKPGDVLLLGSQSFFEIVSEGVIKASLGLDNPEEMVESLAPMVLSRQDLGQAAAVISTLVTETQVNGNELVSFATDGEPDRPTSEAKRNLKDLLKERFSLLKGKISLPSVELGRIRLNRRRSEGKRPKMMILAIILIILFTSSLFLGNRNKKRLEKERQAKILLSQAETKYRQAQEIIDSDANGATSLLEEAASLLAQAKKLSSQPEILRLETEVNEFASKNDKDRNLGEIPIFFDLNLIKEQANANAVSRYKSQLAVFDKGKAAIYTIDLEKKSSEFIAEPKLATVEAIHFTDDRIFAFFEQGVLEVKVKEKKSSVIIPKDSSWGKIVSLSSFAGNLYLLDQEKKTIWQYTKTDSGYSSVKNWLSSSDSSKFDQFVSFAIDGSIWVLGGNGRILKFVQGKQDSFTLKGIKQESLVNAETLYTDEESQFLYLLIGKEKQVVVLSKNGQFQGRFWWSGRPEGPVMIMPWEQQKKVLIIKENSIFDFSVSEVLQ